MKAACERYTEGMKRLGQENSFVLFKMYHQLTFCLEGATDDPTLIKGDFFEEASALLQWREGKFLTALGMYTATKMMLYYLFGLPEKTIAIAREGAQYLGSMMGMLALAHYHFYLALALLARCSDVDPSTRRDYLKQARASYKPLKQWADEMPENFAHFALLVEAELLRVQGRDFDATLACYEQAIALAQRQGFLQDEALAHELTGKFWLERGNETVAGVYLRNAHYAYRLWGAVAKVQDLESRYVDLLTAVTLTPSQRSLVTTSSTSASSSSSTTSATSSLDVATVVKASQTLSQEVHLERLLDQLMRIVIESAGATKGVLIVNEGGRLWVQATGSATGEGIAALQATPLEKSDAVPLSVVHYVARTQTVVVVHQARSDHTYAQDRYIQAHQPQSLLCVPIVHQGNLIGLLYLENSLASDAFTPARMELLDVLAAQAAISLQNVSLYATLEQRVAERTEELAQANVEIQSLNERLKDENLRMSAELAVTQRLQEMLLPTPEELRQIEGLDVAGFMQPAEEVGGDYYDVLPHGGGVKFGIGDMTGHGLESGVVMLMVQTSVRTLLTHDVRDNVRFMDVLNRTLHGNIRRMNVDKSLTLTLLDYAGDGKLTLSGQHEKLILVRKDGALELIDTLDLGFPLGLEADITRFVESLDLELAPGDGVVLYSDGITEAENARAEFYGLERLCAVVQRHWNASSEAIKEAVVGDVRAFVGKHTIYDDLTLLIFKMV